MKTKFIFIFMTLIANSAGASLRVITTTPDLASLVQIVGADSVQTQSLAKGTQDPHQIEAKPSYMVQLRDADLVVAQGLELESAWLEPLVRGARNPKLALERGRLELGRLLRPLDVVTGPVSRADGDVHPDGNPHFQTDPIRMGEAAVLIAKRLGELDSSHSAEFMQRALAWQQKINEKTKEWQARIQKSGVREIVTYHKTFSYFCDRFGLICRMQLEPKPGLPPTAQHLVSVIMHIKTHQVPLVWIENLYGDDVSGKLRAAAPQVRVDRVPVAVGGEPTIARPEDLFERLVSSIEGKKTP